MIGERASAHDAGEHAERLAGERPGDEERCARRRAGRRRTRWDAGPGSSWNPKRCCACDNFRRLHGQIAGNRRGSGAKPGWLSFAVVWTNEIGPPSPYPSPRTRRRASALRPKSRHSLRARDMLTVDVHSGIGREHRTSRNPRGASTPSTSPAASRSSPWRSIISPGTSNSSAMSPPA